MCSSIVSTSSTSPKPFLFNQARTPSTSSSGTDAPLVKPTDLAPSNHSFFNSLSESTRNDFFTPASSATSTSLTEFEELLEPTTINTSTFGAMFFTAA